MMVTRLMYATALASALAMVAVGPAVSADGAVLTAQATTPGPDARDTRVTPRDSSNVIGQRGEIRASNLIGLNVVNAQNETVGDVQEILIMREGKPQVIVSVGGFLGMGRHDVALNWDHLKLVRDGNSVRAEVNLSKEQLKSLPEYRTSN